MFFGDYVDILMKIDSTTIKELFRIGKFPMSYTQSPPYKWPPRRVRFNSKLIYSFAQIDTFEVVEDFNRITWIPKSYSIPKSTYNIEEKGVFAYNEIVKHMIEGDFYETILVDEISNTLYNVISLGQSFEKNDKEVRQIEEKNALILAYNDDFNLLGKYYLKLFSEDHLILSSSLSFYNDTLYCIQRSDSNQFYEISLLTY